MKFLSKNRFRDWFLNFTFGEYYGWYHFGIVDLSICNNNRKSNKIKFNSNFFLMLLQSCDQEPCDFNIEKKLCNSTFCSFTQIFKIIYDDSLIQSSCIN